MIRSLDIYNLEFPSHCHEMTIFGYRFRRVPKYRDRLLTLAHGINSVSEFRVTINSGSHAHTATVEFSTPEIPAVLAWAGNEATAIHDITLLLSIFTLRSAFIDNPLLRGEQPLYVTHDPRQYQWGGILVTSIPYVCSPCDGETEEERALNSYDKGLEIHLNDIYQKIRRPSWLQEYRNGHFLLLYKWAASAAYR